MGNNSCAATSKLTRGPGELSLDRLIERHFLRPATPPTYQIANPVCGQITLDHELASQPLSTATSISSQEPSPTLMETFMRLSSSAYAALLGLTVAIIGITSAAAFEQREFDSASFIAAQAANKSILVDISATWCPTCKAQHTVLKSLAGKPEYAQVVVFQVDFDSQKDAVKSFNAHHQSTLIAFKGARETSRLVGETGAAPIEDLLKSALKN
jgi:thiol-disulfide isomerase/thioredoxin